MQSMFFKTFIAACLATALSIGASFAQTTPTAPVSPAARPPAAASVKPSAIPAGAKVNLNTATAAELDALPQIGKARAKVIMDERAKGSFKDWADFDKRTQHTSVNAGVKAKIKDLVSF
jgi:DNA uptake protein ComE-like DNA-binding protein